MGCNRDIKALLDHARRNSSVGIVPLVQLDSCDDSLMHGARTCVNGLAEEGTHRRLANGCGPRTCDQHRQGRCGIQRQMLREIAPCYTYSSRASPYPLLCMSLGRAIAVSGKLCWDEGRTIYIDYLKRTNLLADVLCARAIRRYRCMRHKSRVCTNKPQAMSELSERKANSSQLASAM